MRNTIAVILSFILSQSFAWFIAISGGWAFGTEEYGFVASVTAVLWLCILPFICVVSGQGKL